MRYAIIIFSLLFQGVSFSQEKTAPVQSESVVKEIEKIEVRTDSELKNKGTKSKKANYQYDKKDNSSIEQSVQFQKFISNKKSASTQRSQRSPSVIQQSKMDEVVVSLEESSPNSFEYHYYKYVAGNYDVSLVSHLIQAEKLRPNNADVIQQKAAFNILTSNKSMTNSYLDKLALSGKLSKNVLNYSWDILLSTPLNGTLITHGFDDTYGTFYMQSVKNVRPDVKIISLELMQSDVFQNSLKKEGYVLPIRNVIDTKFLAEFCKKNVSKNIVISTTTPKEYLQPLSSHLYLTGLVMVYSNSLKENFSRNEDLWNNLLKKHLVTSATTEKAKQLSSNYLPMLLILRKEYKAQNYFEKVKELDKSIDVISVQCKKYEKVQKLKGSY